MSRFSHDRACAEAHGEPVPSLVKVRIWTDPQTGLKWRGYYEMRYTFRPIGDGPFGPGEGVCVKPEEITDEPDEDALLA